MKRPSKAIFASALALAILPWDQSRADSLHCESQGQSSGYLAVEERGYEIFIEPQGSGLAHMRLRLTYFNSSSQPMDLLSRVALPAHSELQELLVRGDHGWIKSKATTKASAQSPSPAGTWFASLLEKSDIPDGMQVAQITGTKLAPSSYTSIELVLSVPVQQRMQTQRLCLPPRMIVGPGLLQERRVTIRDHHGKPKPFWIDDQTQKSNAQVLRANDRDCLHWASKKQKPSALHASFSKYAQGKESNPFALTLELGPDTPRQPSTVTVMLDNSTSVEPSTYHRGAKLYALLRSKLKAKATLWSFAKDAHPLATSQWPPSHAPKAGSDLVQAIQTWTQATRSKSATLVVVTDGLLALPSKPSKLQKLQKTLRRYPKLSIILLVDDPVLAQRGVANDHPLLALASKLGAHLSLQSLQLLETQDLQAEHDFVQALFASPQVGSELKVKLPRSCSLDAPPPEQLISGQVQRLFGHCKTGSKLWARVALKQGRRSRRIKIKASRASQHPTHFASAVSASLRDEAAAHGSTQPSWFRRAMARDSELGFQAAAKIKERHGRLDAELLQIKLREHLWPRAHACYNHALGRNRAQAGVAQLSIALGKGEVSLVEASSRSLTVKDPQFLSCLEAAAWKLRVPAALADPVVYRIYYPLNFQRPKNADVGKISEQDALRYEWLMGKRQ